MIISYNNEGSGLYLSNESVTKEYMLMLRLPLHARVFSLFLTLRNKFHEFYLDNLYMSLNFLHLSCNHQNCVMVQSVCKNVGWVIPRGFFKT